MKLDLTQGRKSIVFTLIGAVLGAVGHYLLTLDQQRLELLRQARRDAYVQFLDAEVILTVGQDPDKYRQETASARKRIAIYGNKEVIEALASYWRKYFDRPDCDATPDKLRDDVRIYQSMRSDIMPWLESISDSDMYMLMFLCRIPDALP
jgi:hypothetical protein